MAHAAEYPVVSKVDLSVLLVNVGHSDSYFRSLQVSGVLLFELSGDEAKRFLPDS